MPAQLKHAWLDLLTALAAVTTYLLLLPFVGPRHATVAIVFMAAGAFAPLFYRKTPGRAGVVSDERDQQIQLRALAVSWAVLWLFFVGFCMITWQLNQGGTIRADLLPNMVGVGYFLVIFTRATVTIAQYRRQV